MKNKILFVLVLFLVAFCAYWAGFKIGGDKGYSDAIDAYMRVNRLTDPARSAAEQKWSEYNSSVSVDTVSTTTPDIPTPSPMPNESMSDAAKPELREANVSG